MLNGADDLVIADVAKAEVIIAFFASVCTNCIFPTPVLSEQVQGGNLTNRRIKSGFTWEDLTHKNPRNPMDLRELREPATILQGYFPPFLKGLRVP